MTAFAFHVAEIAKATGTGVIINPGAFPLSAYLRLESGVGYAGCFTRIPSNTVLLGQSISEEIGTYIVALHELGHIITWPYPVGAFVTGIDRYKGEGLAWMWARRHAVQWTPYCSHLVRLALLTYRRGLNL